MSLNLKFKIQQLYSKKFKNIYTMWNGILKKKNISHLSFIFEKSGNSTMVNMYIMCGE